MHFMISMDECQAVDNLRHNPKVLLSSPPGEKTVLKKKLRMFGTLKMSPVASIMNEIVKVHIT
jgi:hypothetical protein